MKVIKTDIADVLAFEPKVFGDARGFFMESYNGRVFAEAVGRETVFVQDNHSRSARGVLRGLHYQLPPHAQGKLVRVLRGSAFDVVVDIRRDSPTFRRWLGVTLDAESQRQVWIPAGFAHGFISLQDDTVFLYKTTDFYAKECERSILWSDPELAIGWPDVGAPPLLAAKDAAAPVLAQADLF
jgi:dTDP-4-dehydrorhamnose 3,5-epimerase